MPPAPSPVVHFEDRSAELLPADVEAREAEWIDFDGDGWLDLLVETGAALPELYANRDGFLFEPVAIFGTTPASSSSGAAEPGAERTEPDELPEGAAGDDRPRSGRRPVSVGPQARPSEVSETVPRNGHGSGSTPDGAGSLDRQSGGICAHAIHDQSGGPCLAADSTPTLGRLYPISQDLFIDAVTGYVGLGTLAPTVHLDVEGKAEFLGTSFDAAASGRVPGALANGYLGVSGRVNFDGIASADWAGLEIGAAGISADGSPADNVGLMGHSSGVGVRGEHATSPSSDWGELGLDGIGLRAAGTNAAAELLGDVAIQDGLLEMYDGGSNLALRVNPDDVGGGSIGMYNESANQTVFLDSDWANTGYPRLLLNNAAGSTRFIVDGGVSDGGGSASLYATDGSFTLFLDGEAENSGGAVSVRNDVSEETVRLTGDEGDDSGQIVIYDRTGSNNWAGVTIDARDSVGTGGELLIAGAAGATTVDLDGQNGVAPQMALRENDGSLAMQFLSNDLNLYNSAGASTVNWDRQTGTKSAVVDTVSHGRRFVYVVESPEVWFEDFGQGTLVGGSVEIELDPIFLETVTIDERHPMRVFVSHTSPSPGTWVEPGQTSFVVRELPGGTGITSLQWRVLAKRKHLESVRFERAEDQIDTVDADGDTGALEAAPVPVDGQDDELERMRVERQQ